MLRIFTGAFIAAYLTVLVGCGLSGEKIQVRVGGDTSVTIKEGQALELEFESNPTTGYRWGMASSVNKDILRQEREDEFVPQSDLIGAGGVQIFYFKGIKKGDAELVFEYRRPWEKNKEPARKYIVRVSVR